MTQAHLLTANSFAFFSVLNDFYIGVCVSSWSNITLFIKTEPNRRVVYPINPLSREYAKKTSISIDIVGLST